MVLHNSPNLTPTLKPPVHSDSPTPPPHPPFLPLSLSLPPHFCSHSLRSRSVASLMVLHELISKHLTPTLTPTFAAAAAPTPCRLIAPDQPQPKYGHSCQQHNPQQCSEHSQGGNNPYGDAVDCASSSGGGWWGGGAGVHSIKALDGADADAATAAASGRGGCAAGVWEGVFGFWVLLRRCCWVACEVEVKRDARSVLQAAAAAATTVMWLQGQTALMVCADQPARSSVQ